MWLMDFEEAIAAMRKHCNYSCFDRIETNIFEDSFLFCPYDNNFYFIYHRKSGKIVKHYSATWRNSEHYEIIYEGDK